MRPLNMAQGRHSIIGKLDEGELRSSVDRHEEVELSLGGLHFGDVDVEEADRIRLELFLCRLVAFDLSKTADPMPFNPATHSARRFRRRGPDSFRQRRTSSVTIA